VYPNDIRDAPEPQPVAATLKQVAAISFAALTKRYGQLTAVSNLTFAVEEGEILGFLGLNGAGKTTSIRILLDLLRPSSGQASIFGHDCQREALAARDKVGYLPAELGLYGDMTGRELLTLFARLSPRPVDPNYVGQLQERLALPEADVRRKLREYSSGMKRKLGIIQALQSDPPLLIMDEPTDGLDPLMQDSFYALLSDLQRRGRTIFFSSHVLSEVERVCQRVALVRKGELVLLATVEETRKLAPRDVRITFRADVPAPAAALHPVRSEPRMWQLKVQGPLGPLLRDLAELPVDDIEVSEARLEDAVRNYYQGDGA
jgi:ABC-2 type transport system ATP-binding protein